MEFRLTLDSPNSHRYVYRIVGFVSRAISSLGKWLAGKPALSIAGLLAAGISLHSVIWRSPQHWLGALVGLVVVGFLVRRNTGLAAVLLLIAVLVVGILLGQLADYQFAQNDIALFVTEQPRLAWLELQFDESPRVDHGQGLRRMPDKQVGIATVVSMRSGVGWKPASGQVQFSVTHAQPILAGRRVRVVGMLQRPSGAMNPGEFDWQNYCRRQRVLGSIRVSHACDVQVMSMGAVPTLDQANVGVRDWLALGFAPGHEVDRALLQALLLGDRPPEIHAVARDFQKTGTSHLLSSSGLRMAVLAAAVWFLCRLIGIRPRIYLFVVCLCVIGWACLTAHTPQSIRPVVVALVVALGLAMGRKVGALQVLAFAAIFILVLRPLDLYSAGFQFSFVLVLGLILLTPPLALWLSRYSDPDIEALHRFGKLSPWQQIRRNALGFLRQAIAATLVAWVVSIPLVAWHFEQFTPWAVPLTLFLSPLVAAIVGIGFFKLAASMLVPSMALVWATLAGWPLMLLRDTMALAAHLPLADVTVPQPPIWQIFAFYALACLAIIPANARPTRWALRGGLIVGCTLMVLIWLTHFAGQSASPGTLRVTLLSIGAGQCGVVEPPTGGALMVDAGSSTISDPFHSVVQPFLHHEGHTSLPTICLSHGDYDHISATASAFEDYGLDQVVTTPFFRNHAVESPTCRHLLEELDRAHHSPREVVAGQSFDWGGGATSEVLWPPKQCDMNSNNAGMVIRLSYAGKSILFPADIQDPAMSELLKSPQKLRSDILVAAHHGSSEPLTAAFVRAVNPEIIVSSDADHLTKKQRDFEGMIDHRPLYRTSHCGAITIEVDRTGRLTVKPFLSARQPSMVVEKDGTVHAQVNGRQLTTNE